MDIMDVVLLVSIESALGLGVYLFFLRKEKNRIRKRLESNETRLHRSYNLNRKLRSIINKREQQGQVLVSERNALKKRCKEMQSLELDSHRTNEESPAIPDKIIDFMNSVCLVGSEGVSRNKQVMTLRLNLKKQSSIALKICKLLDNTKDTTLTGNNPESISSIIHQQQKLIKDSIHQAEILESDLEERNQLIAQFAEDSNEMLQSIYENHTNDKGGTDTVPTPNQRQHASA